MAPSSVSAERGRHAGGRGGGGGGERREEGESHGAVQANPVLKDATDLNRNKNTPPQSVLLFLEIRRFSLIYLSIPAVVSLFF